MEGEDGWPWTVTEDRCQTKNTKLTERRMKSKPRTVSELQGRLPVAWVGAWTFLTMRVPDSVTLR